MFAPGTILETDPEHFNPLTCIPDVLWDSGGLVMGQLRQITGLETAVIQNWIKRGYVAPPINKHYTIDQVARILIINALRDSLPLEKIAQLIRFVNGSLVDTSDDLIADSRLYDLFCCMAVVLQENNYHTFEQMEAFADVQTASIEPAAARPRIRTVLLLMSVCYQSILIRQRVENWIDEL